MKPTKAKSKSVATKRKQKADPFADVLALRAKRALQPPRDPDPEEPYEPTEAERAVMEHADRLAAEHGPGFDEGLAAWLGLQKLAEKFAPNLPTADLARAVELGHFLVRILVGHENPGDRGRLLRMRAVMHESDESRRTYVVQFVRGALSPNGWPRPAMLRDALARFADPAFGSLDAAATEALISNPGRRGAHAIAAELSLRCKAFGDVGESKAVAARFEQAARALKS
ncbi:MAG TPA: hypothetical protein VJN18_25165 [Polyangiaceae bacterium]|nr:hypothetical protein [Polyangiaceae bacterium]